MKILVTGSSGHLGEALVRTLRGMDHEIIGVDCLSSDYTNRVGSIVDREFVKSCMGGVSAVIHTATLHKPHVATHSCQDFINTNITGTLNLLEEAVAANVGAFVFTSTTSTFGHALIPPPGLPCAWITEEVKPIPKNIYGVTKIAAEDLCELFHRLYKLPCLILRTSRFFPEPDDDEASRKAFADDNLKANEFLSRRVDVQDVVDAHLIAIEKARVLGFGRYIISATTPFMPADLPKLRLNAPEVLAIRLPEYEREFARLGWKMSPSIDRVYINEKARRDLGWQPSFDFKHVLKCIALGDDPRSPLARAIGSKGYHLKQSN